MRESRGGGRADPGGENQGSLDRLRRDLDDCLEERARLASRELEQRRLIENITGGYFFYRHDTERNYEYLSPSVRQILGYSPEEYIERYASLFTDAAINDEAREHTRSAIAGEPQYSFEAELRARDGSLKVLEVSEVPVFGDDGRVVWIEGIAHDVTERRQMMTRLHELATLDELTGLFNRRHLRFRLEEAMSLSRRHGFPLSMAMVDLDGLKSVNDSFGHAAGDRLICAAARILQQELRRGDVIGRLETVAGRLGGDEFAALLPYSRLLDGRTALQRVLDAFARAAIEVAPGEVRALRASVGIAELRADDTAEAIERRADEALYRAKREFRGTICLEEGAEG